MPDDDDDDDLLRTGEVAVVPLEEVVHEDVMHGTGPIDAEARRFLSHRPVGTSDAPLPPFSHPPTDPPISPRYEPMITPSPPSAPREEGWLHEDTSLTRATEKTLSVPAKITIDRATLTLITGLNAGQVFPLDALDNVIGRGTEADVWVEDPAISRRHVRITRKADGLYLAEDLRSTNGTFVSGRRIDGRAELSSGDRLQIGPTLILRFAITDDAEEELQRRLYESSTRDALTRAFNRKYFSERLVAEIAHARRHKTQLALLMLDLDRFKEVNDTHGHLAGDMVLRVVSAQIQRLIRVEDVLARYGGEELVILIRATGHKEAGVLAERVRSTIANLAIPVADASISITTSIGIASLAELDPEAGPNELIAIADARLYRAKANGRNCICGED